MPTWAKVVRNPRNTRSSWTVRYQDPTTSKHKEKSFVSKAEASKFANSIKYRADTGTWIKPEHQGEPFVDAAERWIDFHVGADATKRIYRSALNNYIKPAYGDTPIDRVARDRQGVQRLLLKDMPAKGLSASTIRTTYRIFTGTVREAIANGRLSRTAGALIFTSIKLPPIAKRAEIYYPTYAQLEKLAKGMKEHAFLVWLIRGTGLRIGEAMAVKHESFTNGTLRINQQFTTKGKYAPLKARKPGDYRDIPCPRYVQDMIPDGEGYLFAPKSRRQLDRRFHDARKAAGLPDGFTFHTLRHIFASVALSEGIPILDVSRWLGHTSITTTADQYGHLVPVAFDRAREVLDAEYQEWKK